jgi:hypothetical protein
MKYFTAGCFFILLIACKNETKVTSVSNEAPSPSQIVKHGNPDWDDHAVMYEVNILLKVLSMHFPIMWRD